jgi:transposase
MTLDDFEPLGSDESVVRWEYLRAHIVQVRYVMPKMRARNDKSVIVHASAPPTPAPGGKYGASVYAHLIVQRILNNMPLQRLSASWRRDGADIAPSVLVDLFHRAATLCGPIDTRIRNEVRSATHVCADETGQPMQAPNTGKTHRGWMWMALCDTAIAYHFSPSRSTEAGRELLGDKVTNLMVDGYSAYNNLVATEGRAACWAHARRLFWELRKNWKEAEEILLTIREIYRVEVMTRARSDDPAVLLRARQVEAKPLVEKVLGIVDSMKGEFGDNTAQAKAIGYIANRPDELKRFLDDPNVPLDNNISERALRIVAQGRKSSLFVGPGNCGKSLATLLTVVRTCELIGVNAYDYLVDVLPRLAMLTDRKDSPGDASPEFDCLTPAAWRAAHPAGHRKSRR